MSKNKVTDINSQAVIVISYSYNIYNWKLSEWLRLDKKTRK